MDEMCWCWFWLCVADPDSGFVPGARSSSAPGIPAHNTLHLKGKLQSTDPSAFLELCAQSAAWWLNCHMHCANIPGNVGHGSVDLSWGFWLPVAQPLSSPAEKPPCATTLTFPRLPWSLEQGGNVLLPFCHRLEAGMWLGKRKGRMDYSLLSPALPSGRRQRDKHEIIVEIKTNTQNIWHWVKCFSWASGLCFALLFRLGEISTLWESASQSLLHKRYSETSVMYSCLFKKMGHFHTNVIFLCRKYAEFIPYLLVKAIPLLVLWFQHICLTGDNQKMRRKNYYFLINSCRPNVRLSTWVQHLWTTHRNIILQWLFFFFLSRVSHKAQRAAALLRAWRLGERSFSDVSVKEDAWMSSGEQPFTQEPTGWRQQGSDELCKSPPHRVNFI